MHAAEKHEARSDKLAALVAEARELIEQARAAEAERARVAAEATAAAAAVKAAEEAEAAAELQQLDAEMAALDTRRQQVQAKLGSGSGTPQPDAEETMCVVCFDAPKEYAIVPCGHMCVCEACAELMTKTITPMCPVCRAGPSGRP
jgi:hypothetical protein